MNSYGDTITVKAPSGELLCIGIGYFGDGDPGIYIVGLDSGLDTTETLSEAELLEKLPAIAAVFGKVEP